MADLLLQPLVVDSGSLTTRVGYAGGTVPKHSFPSATGVVKHRKVMGGGALDDGKQQSAGPSSSYVGSKLSEHPGAFTLTPSSSYNGQVTSYASLTQLHRHAVDVMGLADTTLADTIASHPVLLAENVCGTNQQRTRAHLAQFLFEEMSVPALFFAPSGVLALYAAGCTTGAVLDVGEASCQCTPIYEGLGLSHSSSSSSVAGRRVTEHLKNTLRSEVGLHMTTSAEFQIVRRMKEEVGVVATQAADAPPTPATSFLLPDGTPVTLPAAVRSDPFEVLFDPATHAGLEEPSVVHQLHQAIASADMDLRASLYSNIVLAGGTTLANNFGHRLLTELRAKAPVHTRVKVTAPVERIHAVWTGGSILASLSTFKGMWITKAQYDEEGAGVLRVKML
jgi:centractin